MPRHCHEYLFAFAYALLLSGNLSRPAHAAPFDALRLPAAASHKIDFVKDVQPIFATRCHQCHGPDRQRNDLRLDSKELALAGGASGKVISPGDGTGSLLVRYVSGLDEKNVMPPEGDRLTPEQVGVLRAWIDQGAAWPDAASVQVKDKGDLWSVKPIQRVEPPAANGADAEWAINPIDAFVLAALKQNGLAPSKEADRRTLMRRLYFDLVGLPPSPEDVDRFIADPDPLAYDKLVDRLLASPAYGERWARHWLDVVHYGDTHGYDKDKLRPNAWPYRDYVIRALNEDKPYDQFVREQLAGDVFAPDTRDGITALGFLAAGPWDFVGQVEVRDGTLEKARVRNIDRDDMVTVATNTFVSLTAQCARCHNHKFDPISQEDYYALQAVFAAVDRADRPFDADPGVAKKRRELGRERVKLSAMRDQQIARVREAGGEGELAALDQQIAGAVSQGRPEYGYHSNIELRRDAVKWVQVDLGAPAAFDRVLLAPCDDSFNNIGPGFGFPIRYKVEASNDATFATGVTILADYTGGDIPNPGTTPASVAGSGVPFRYVRVTATKLAPRQDDYIFALAELRVIRADGTDAARDAAVTSLDSIEAGPRWGRANLVDGIYPAATDAPPSPELARLRDAREKLIASKAGVGTLRTLDEIEGKLADNSASSRGLPTPIFVVYAAATDFQPEGEFRATFGAPRSVHLLHRGGEDQPRELVPPGTVGAIRELPSRFTDAANGNEAARRAALAEWVVSEKNVLTWRSIVNRVWYYHFGRGIVETPNDFGHMGDEPSHPELLDWLSAEFRDAGDGLIRDRSLKQLHRLIVTSRTYRQSSANNANFAKIDAGNQYLWRQNRRRIDAEAIRDTILSVTGLLDTSNPGGPPFKSFGFEDDHSPRYDYASYNPDDPATHRRSIYRLIVRSVPDPFMETLDCADPSQIVERRNETLTALQALSLMNNKFVVRMAERFAERAEKSSPDLEQQIRTACRLALERDPTADELNELTAIARKHGLSNACRLILNMNEFVFLD